MPVALAATLQASEALPAAHQRGACGVAFGDVLAVNWACGGLDRAYRLRSGRIQKLQENLHSITRYAFSEVSNPRDVWELLLSASDALALLVRRAITAAAGAYGRCNAEAAHAAGYGALCSELHSSLRGAVLEADGALQGHLQGPLGASGRFGVALQAALTAVVAFRLLVERNGALCESVEGQEEDPCAATRACHDSALRVELGSRDLVSASELLDRRLEAAFLWLQHGEPPGRAPVAMNFCACAACLPSVHCELEGLLQRARPRPPQSRPLRVVEIGVHIGYTTSRILQMDPHLQYLGVDPYAGEYCPGFGVLGNLQKARKAVRPHRHRAALCRRPSALAARSPAACSTTWPRRGKVDLLYIDGAHDEESVAEDVRLWARRVRRGGIVAGHDYGMETAEVARGVHRTVPAGARLHLGLDKLWWWRKP